MIRYKKMSYETLDLADIEKTIPYYRDSAGLQLNDQDENAAYFSGSDDQHNMRPCSAPTLDLQRTASTLDNDVPGVPGLDSVTLEFSFDVEEFPEHDPRKLSVLEPRSDSMDYWGSRPNESFGKVGNILPAQKQLTGTRL